MAGLANGITLAGIGQWKFPPARVYDGRLRTELQLCASVLRNWLSPHLIAHPANPPSCEPLVVSSPLLSTTHTLTNSCCREPAVTSKIPRQTNAHNQGFLVVRTIESLT